MVVFSRELKGLVLIIIVAFSAYLTIVQIVNTYPPAGILKSFSVQSLRRPSSSDTYLMGDSLLIQARSDWASQYDLRVCANSSTVFESRVAGGSHLRMEVPLVPPMFIPGGPYTLSLNALVLNNPILGASYADSASYAFEVNDTQTQLGLVSVYDNTTNWLYSLANLTDVDGYPVTNETVGFYVQLKGHDPLTDGWIPMGSCVTDGNGTAELSIGFPLLSDMAVKACHEDDGNYGPCETSVDVQVASNVSESYPLMCQNTSNDDEGSNATPQDPGTVDLKIDIPSPCALLSVNVTLNYTVAGGLPLHGEGDYATVYYLDNLWTSIGGKRGLPLWSIDGSSYKYWSHPCPVVPTTTGTYLLIGAIVPWSDFDSAKKNGTDFVIAQGNVTVTIRPCPTNLVLHLPENAYDGELFITAGFAEARVYEASDDGEFTASSLAQPIPYDGLSYVVDEPVKTSVPVDLIVNGTFENESWTDSNGVASFTYDLSSSGASSVLDVKCKTNCSTLVFDDSVAESIVGVTMVNISDCPEGGNGLFSLACTVAGQAPTDGLDSEPVYVEGQNQVELTASLSGSGVSEANVSMLVGQANCTNCTSASGMGCWVPQGSNLLRVVSLYDINTTKALASADVNRDGKVDGRDITLVAKCFGSIAGNPRWSWPCDINFDRKIDGRDITLCAKGFGQKVNWTSVPADFSGVNASFLENGVWNNSSLDSSGCITVPNDASWVNFTLDGSTIGAVVQFFKNASLITPASLTDDSGITEASWTPSFAAPFNLTTINSRNPPYVVLAWLPPSVQVATTQPASETTVTDSLSTAVYLNVTTRPVSLVLTSNFQSEELSTVTETPVEAGIVWDDGYDGTYPYLMVGYNNSGLGSPGSGGYVDTFLAYVRFDTPTSIPVGSTILSARIKVYCYAGSLDQTRTYGIYPLTQNVPTGQMYSVAPQGPPSYSSYSSLVSWLPGQVGWWSFDVTGDVRSWYSALWYHGSDINYGYLIMDQYYIDSDEWVQLNYGHSAVGNPVLEVTYVQCGVLPVSLDANLVDGVNGTPISGNAIFTVAGSSWQSSTNNPNNYWYGGPQTSAAYTAVASYAGTPSTYQAASDSLVLDFRTATNLTVNGYTSLQELVSGPDVMNVSANEWYHFDCSVNHPIAASEGVQVLVNNVSQPSLTLGSSLSVSFPWKPNEIGVYYINFSYGGNANYALSQVNIVAMAQASPVCLSFNAAPSEFAPGTSITLYAQAINPLDGKPLDGVDVTFLQNGTSHIEQPQYVKTDENGVASVPWYYDSTWSVCAVNASVESSDTIGNLVLATQPVTLTVGSETQILLSAWRDPSGTGHTIYAQLVDGLGHELGSGYTVTLTVNGTDYVNETNSTGYVTLHQALQPGDTSANTYEVMAMFNGTNPRSTTTTALDSYGDEYASCITNQYDLRPSTNSSTLQVLLQTTDAITAKRTMEQMQSDAKAEGLQAWGPDSWCPWPPFFKLHARVTVDSSGTYVQNWIGLFACGVDSYAGLTVPLVDAFQGLTDAEMNIAAGTISSVITGVGALFWLNAIYADVLAINPFSLTAYGVLLLEYAAGLALAISAAEFTPYVWLSRAVLYGIGFALLALTIGAFFSYDPQARIFPSLIRMQLPGGDLVSTAAKGVLSSFLTCAFTASNMLAASIIMINPLMWPFAIITFAAAVTAIYLGSTR